MNLLAELETLITESPIDLKGFNLDQLKRIISDANLLISEGNIKASKYRKEYSKEMLKVGDIVEVTGSKFKGELFEVVKLNIKKVKCKRENGEIWNIPYAHILMS